jgi:RNA polymerase sigma factor (sigma-70 family)
MLVMESGNRIFFSSILLVDDHPLYREGLRLSLKPYSTMILDAPSAESALQILSQRPVHLMITDLAFPQMLGIDLCYRVKSQWPSVKIAVLSQCSDAVTLQDLIDLPVDALLLKVSSLDSLVDALQALSQGRQWIDPFAWQTIQGKRTSGALSLLTRRERQILSLVARGMTEIEIAKELQCSPETVKTHKAKARQKLNLKNNVEMTAWYLSQDSEISRVS